MGTFAGELLAEAPKTLPGRKTERRNFAARECLLQRVTSEFREMPDLRLTGREAERLFSLRSDVCGRLIDRLMRDGVLRRDAEGRYATV
jgi:hypothetical protein